MKPPAHFQLEAVTQRQLMDVLCLEEEVRMIRAEIRRKKARIADALALGAIIESGCHECKLNSHGGVKVYAFRGAILRYSDEDDSTPARRSAPVVTHKKASAKPFLILAPRSANEGEQAPPVA